LAQAEKDLALEKKGHSADAAGQADLKHDCNSKAQNYEVEYRDASKAVKAMIEAEKILKAKFGSSLLETSVARRVASRAAVQVASDDGKTRALRLIEQLGRRLKSTALVSLSYRAAADPFQKVRGMVEDMLAKLQQEAAEEATHEAFCQEEMAKTKKSKQIKEMDIAKTDARLEKASSGVQSLTEAITTLSGEVTDLDTSMAEVTSVRHAEKARFTATDTELTESIDAVRQAIEALQSYYSKGPALIQEGAFVPPVLQMLEFCESDFETLLADARAAESTAAEQYDQITKDGKEDKTIKEAEVNSKKSEVKSLNMALRNYGEDKEGTSTELDAVLSYLGELKPKCEQEAPPSYAERKAAREQELDGLKEALKLLE
jgi:chromosome segregation ATPase